MTGVLITGDRNSSQFFFTLKALPQLDGKQVVFGEVMDGLNVLQMIQSVKTEKGDDSIFFLI